MLLMRDKFSTLVIEIEKSDQAGINKKFIFLTFAIFVNEISIGIRIP